MATVMGRVQALKESVELVVEWMEALAPQDASARRYAPKRSACARMLSLAGVRSAS